MFLPHLKNVVQSVHVETAPAPIVEPRPAPLSPLPPSKDFLESGFSPGEYRNAADTVRACIRSTGDNSAKYGRCERCAAHASEVFHVTFRERVDVDGETVWPVRPSVFCCQRCAVAELAKRGTTEPAPEPLRVHFGDYAETVDGSRRGIVRGSGGIGSNRVQLEDTNGGRTWHSWEELRPISGPPLCDASGAVYAPEPPPSKDFLDASTIPGRLISTYTGRQYEFTLPDGSRKWVTVKRSEGMTAARAQLAIQLATEPAPPSKDFLEMSETEPAEPETATAPEPAPAGDDSETFADFVAKETAVVEFGKTLERERVATLQDITAGLITLDNGRFGLSWKNGAGEPQTIAQGFYGYDFSSVERTVGYAVQKARELYVCEPVRMPNGSEIERRYHTRRGAFVYVVTRPISLSRTQFNAEENKAARLGGWYSREFRPNFERGGFMFERKAAALQFANDFRGGKPKAERETPEPAPQASPSKDFLESHDSQTSPDSHERRIRNAELMARTGTAARLEELADAMEKTIAERLRPMTQNWTRKRGREYASRVHDGENLKRCQEALRVLAQHWRAGTVPAGLRDLKTKTAVLPLVSCCWDSCHDRGTDEPRDNSPKAVELRQLVTAARSPETAAANAERERRKKIEEAETALRGRNVPGFFPTPPALVERMIEAAALPEQPCILEPSAGIGSIVDGLTAAGVSPDRIECVEVSQSCVTVCDLKGYRVSQGDFLAMEPPADSEPAKQFDRILMNPPFENLADIDHVRHAFRFLRPGGRLVAIMSEGSFNTSGRRKCQEFAYWLNEVGAVSEPVRDAFNDATAFRSTGVSVRLVVIDK